MGIKEWLWGKCPTCEKTHENNQNLQKELRILALQNNELHAKIRELEATVELLKNMNGNTISGNSKITVRMG